MVNSQSSIVSGVPSFQLALSTMVRVNSLPSAPYFHSLASQGYTTVLSSM